MTTVNPTPRCVALLVGLGMAVVALAHPLGNATVNRQSQLKIEQAQVSLSYLLDLAEIPTLVAVQDADRDGDGAVSTPEWRAFAGSWAHSLRSQLALTLDGRPLGLALRGVTWSLADGAAGLQQLRLRARYTAAISSTGSGAELAYHDRSRPQEAGWREIWLSTGAGVQLLASDVGQTDRSHELTRFPNDASALPDETSAQATLTFTPRPTSTPLAPPPPMPAPQGVDPPADSASEPDTSPSPSPAPSLAATATPPPDAASPAAFFWLGVYHIATGWDHLVFLLGLLLFSQTLLHLLKIVTAFTLAHSVTLGLAAAGLVTPPAKLIEPAIALSITYVGLANLLWRHRAHGVVVAFCFGCIHGFGFAGALAGFMGASLANAAHGSHRWLLDLATFNLGIEAFQVTVLCLAVTLMRMTAHFDGQGLARRGAALGVLGTGLSLFLLRVLPLI